jgi:hypothetical protein
MTKLQPFAGQPLSPEFLKNLLPMFVEYREGDTWHKCQLSKVPSRRPQYVFRRHDKVPQHSALREWSFDSPASAYAFACKQSRRRGSNACWRKVDVTRMTRKHWHVRGAPKDETNVVVLKPGKIIDLD